MFLSVGVHFKRIQLPPSQAMDQLAAPYAEQKGLLTLRTHLAGGWGAKMLRQCEEGDTTQK